MYTVHGMRVGIDFKLETHLLFRKIKLTMSGSSRKLQDSNFAIFGAFSSRPQLREHARLIPIAVCRARLPLYSFGPLAQPGVANEAKGEVCTKSRNDCRRVSGWHILPGRRVDVPRCRCGWRTWCRHATYCIMVFFRRRHSRRTLGMLQACFTLGGLQSCFSALLHGRFAGWRAVVSHIYLVGNKRSEIGVRVLEHAAHDGPVKAMARQHNKNSESWSSEMVSFCCSLFLVKRIVHVIGCLNPNFSLWWGKTKSGGTYQTPASV